MSRKTAFESGFFVNLTTGWEITSYPAACKQVVNLSGWSKWLIGRVLTTFFAELTFNRLEFSSTTSFSPIVRLYGPENGFEAVFTGQFAKNA